jgi:serralysin
MRDAQCASADAVKNVSYQIALSFVQSAEYAARDRDNTEYVEDLYNGILRRGADCAGFTAWVNSLNGGTTRGSVLKSFTDSPEFQTRVNAVIAAGCLP